MFKLSARWPAMASLLAMFAAAPCGAQDNEEPAPQPESADVDVIEPITLENSKHVTDPLFTDDMPDDIAAPLPAETPDERMRRLFTLYKNAIAEGSFTEADTLGKRIVELTMSAHGRDSEETARALTNLAIAQHGMEDYEAAEINFRTAIEIIEHVEDRLNEDLINPLKGLGAAQIAEGHPEKALETFGRAVHVSHVNEGPHNLMQIELLESMASTYLAAGDIENTVNTQQHIFNLRARNVDPDSEDLIPALQSQAQWQHRLELYDRERATWRRIIDILEDHRGRDDLSLISPLTGLGRSYLYFAIPDVSYQQTSANSTGEVYLKRALHIAEDNPQSDWRLHAQALLALADYYILSDKGSRAERVYRDAWDLLSTDEQRLQTRYTELETLQVLQGVRPPKFYGLDTVRDPGQQPEGFETGTVVFEYTISPRGTATDIELVQLDPAGLEDMENTVGRELRHMVQRPRMVDGNTVSTEKLTYTHNFYYRLSDLPGETADNASLASSDND